MVGPPAILALLAAILQRRHMESPEYQQALRSLIEEVQTQQKASKQLQLDMDRTKLKWDQWDRDFERQEGMRKKIRSDQMNRRKDWPVA